MRARLWKFDPGDFKRRSKHHKWLDDWEIVFRFLAVVRGFYIFHIIQTVFRAHLTSYPLDIRTSFTGLKRPADKLATRLCPLQMLQN
jgi:hypothetical protein